MRGCVDFFFKLNLLPPYSLPSQGQFQFQPALDSPVETIVKKIPEEIKPLDDSCNFALERFPDYFQHLKMLLQRESDYHTCTILAGIQIVKSSPIIKWSAIGMVI